MRIIPSDASGFESIFEIARTGELSNTELKKYLSAMITDYDKLVIGEYNHQKGFQQGMEQGLEQGLELGRQEGVELGRKDMEAAARKMIKDGLDTDTICWYTGFSPEQVMALKSMS